MSEELTVIAELHVKPGCEAQAQAAMRACAQHSRNEPGCMSYEPHADPGDPRRFVFVERWASPAALAAHERTPHFLSLAKSLETMLTSPLAVSRLKALAP